MKAISRRLAKLEEVFAPVAESEDRWGSMAEFRVAWPIGALARNSPRLPKRSRVRPVVRAARPELPRPETVYPAQWAGPPLAKRSPLGGNYNRCQIDFRIL